MPERPGPAFGRAVSVHEVAPGAMQQHGSPGQWQRLEREGEQMLGQIAQCTLQSESLLHFSWEQLPAQLLALQDRNFSGKQIILL